MRVLVSLLVVCSMNIRIEFTAINGKITSTLNFSADVESNPGPYEAIR